MEITRPVKRRCYMKPFKLREDRQRISVDDRLPEDEKPVLIWVIDCRGKLHHRIAFYRSEDCSKLRKSEANYGIDDDHTNAGWYEQGDSRSIHDWRLLSSKHRVLYWTPLPELEV